MKTFINISFFSLLLLSLAVLSSSKDIYVVPNGGMNAIGCGGSLHLACANIKLGLSFAKTGDRILLQQGTFSGPTNTNLQINIPKLKIIGIPKTTIIDLENQGFGFVASESDVVFSNLIIKNGFSKDSSLAGGITVKAKIGSTSTGTSLSNVLFVNIIGGGLLIDYVSSTSSSHLQSRLDEVSFVNVTSQPALSVFGDIQIQLNNCLFKNNGFPSQLNSTSNSTKSSPQEISGSAIFVQKNNLGMISLSGCNFVSNQGSNIIETGSSLDQTHDELIFVGTNTFSDNVASNTVIQTNPSLSLMVCLGCEMVWNGNQAPVLCDVMCDLLGVSDMCPGSCPASFL